MARYSNGSGTVYEMKDSKRAKKYRAMLPTQYIYDKKTNTLKTIRKSAGCYKTRREAREALSAYISDPMRFANKTITFADMHERFRDEHYEKVSHQAVALYEACFKRCTPLHRKSYVDLRHQDFQDIINTVFDGLSRSYKSTVRIYWGQLAKIGLRDDIIVKDYSKVVYLGKPTAPARAKSPFTAQEVAAIACIAGTKKSPHRLAAGLLLINLYTGMRPSEIASIKKDSVDFVERYMVGGIKTSAGKNRIIPLHSNILPFIEELCAQSDIYLMDFVKRDKIYPWVLAAFKELMAELGFSHTPHDARRTFVTRMSELGVSETTIAKIVGHKKGNITADVYILKQAPELVRAVDLLRY